jgi:formate dehydrogenase major subunit
MNPSFIIASDLIITIGGDISQSYPVMAMKIREAVGKGTKLATIGHETTALNTLAKIDLKIKARITIVLLRAALNYIIGYDLIDHKFVNTRTQGFDDLVKEIEKYPFDSVSDIFWVKPTRIIEFIHLYIRAKRPVIIVNTDRVNEEELALLHDMASITGNLDREGAGIITLRNPGNAQGLIDMGVNPDYLPGDQPIDNERVRKQFTTYWHRQIPFSKGMDTGEIIDGIGSGKISGLIVFGSDALGERGYASFKDVKFSVFMSSTLPADEPYPDVVLPLATFVESEGTFTNCEHRIQYLNRALSPVSGKANWEIIAQLSSALGYHMEYDTIGDIMTEVSRLVPRYKSNTVSQHHLIPQFGQCSCLASPSPLPYGDNGTKEQSKVLKAV